MKPPVKAATVHLALIAGSTNRRSISADGMNTAWVPLAASRMERGKLFPSRLLNRVLQEPFRLGLVDPDW